METKKVILKINKKEIELTSNTPDMQKIIDFIVENRENINVDEISIETNDEQFDKNGFEEMIKEVVNEYLNKIKLEEDELDRLLKELKTND